MTTKVHDGTYWNDKNIRLCNYKHLSKPIKIYEWNFTVCTLHLNKTNFKKKAKAIYLRDPEVIITSIHAIQHMHIIIKDIMFVVRTEI